MEKRIAQLKEQGCEGELICLGNKGITYFQKRETPVRKSIPCSQAPTAAQAQEICQEILSSFYSKELDDDEIFQLTSQDGQISVEKETVPAAAPEKFTADTIFEQEPSQLLNAILPLYLNGQILRTLQESVASELAARMSAMQAATDNAKDLQG